MGKETLRVRFFVVVKRVLRFIVSFVTLDLSVVLKANAAISQTFNSNRFSVSMTMFWLLP